MPLTFVNQVIAPTASMSPASVTGSTTATLYGVLSDGYQSAAGGGDSSYQFQYGTSATFASYTSTTSTAFSGMGTGVSASVTGLTSGSRYYARVVATNDTATTTGNAVSFEYVAGGMPQLIGPGSAVLAGTAVTFSWTYTSGGASGGQTGYSLQVTGTVPGESGSGPWYWTGSAWSGSATWITSTASSVTIPATYFSPNVSYSWTVATEDAGGQGPYA